ncbi:AMY1.4 [Symbiodinium natans]|uniref:AMY1.4 protein n=1 Tax=Symbiodinium natans TaxID=878477 RepID=A0A812JB12_9DINO|nr:AMY1.4 [Symbiodinium natans]
MKLEKLAITSSRMEEDDAPEEPLKDEVVTASLVGYFLSLAIKEHVLAVQLKQLHEKLLAEHRIETERLDQSWRDKFSKELSQLNAPPKETQAHDAQCYAEERNNGSAHGWAPLGTSLSAPLSVPMGDPQEPLENGLGTIPYRWADLAIKLADSDVRNMEEDALSTSVNCSLVMHPNWTISVQEAMKRHQLRNYHMPGVEESTSTLRMNEAIKDSSCLQRFIIPPGSLAQLVLSALCSCLIVWDLITIPLEPFDLPNFQSFLVSFGKVTFVFWVLNIPLQFILGVEVEGKIEIRPPVLARLYLRTWFALDVVVVSLDAVLIFLEDSEAGLKSARFLRALRLLRLVRLLRVARLQHQLTLLANRFLSANAFMVMKVVAGLCGILAVNHLIACTWYGLGSWTEERSWIVRMEMQEADFLDYYATSIHWALTQFTPATNNVAPENAFERLFAIFVILLAMGMFSSFISALTSTVSAYRNARMEQFHQHSLLLRFFTERNLSTDLYGKIREVIRKERHTGIRLREDEVHLLHKVPGGLKFQLHEEMFLSQLNRLPFWPAWSHFEDQHFFKALCHGAMAERVTTKGHDAFTPEGDCLEVCVVESGSMSYEPAMSWHCERVREGAVLCMAAIWAEWQYRGRLSASFGTCYYIGIDVAQFSRLAAHAGGPLWQFLQIFGFLFISSIEAMDEGGELATDLCCEMAKISELVSRTQRYCDTIREKGVLFHAASGSKRGTAASPRGLLQKHEARPSVAERAPIAPPPTKTETHEDFIGFCESVSMLWDVAFFTVSDRHPCSEYLGEYSQHERSDMHDVNVHRPAPDEKPSAVEQYTTTDPSHQNSQKGCLSAFARVASPRFVPAVPCRAPPGEGSEGSSMLIAIAASFDASVLRNFLSFHVWHLSGQFRWDDGEGATAPEAPVLDPERAQSRHLFQNSDGSLNMQMSRTASLMLVDMDEFCAEAEAEEGHIVELERDRLNAQQRRIASSTLIEEMAKITDYADPSGTVMLQGFNWESHKAGKGNWYGIVESKVEMLADLGITDVWLPPCSQSVAPQGYLPSQLFNLDASAYGKKDALKSLLKALHDKGMRGVADIVINHRCGDKQDEQGRWNVFTSTGIESRKSFHGIMDWQGWAITLGDKFSDGTGERGPGNYDGKFDAAPDIDHGNKKVQSSIAIWLRWLRLDIGFDAWRFDFVKGYGAEYVGHYCKKSEPSWAVGELWLDMEYDHDGLKYNQDKHRQDTVNWINGTDKESTAFDFTTKGILQEAVRNTQYWRLKDSNGKPPGLLGWMPTHAVTFLDNHDTGSTQAHWPFPNDKVLVGYAYILTHPGIPCIFWDHVCDWGEDMRNRIKTLLQLRRRAGIKVDDQVNILCADQDLYIAEIGSPAALRVALGPKHSGVDGGWAPGAEGADYRVWIREGK